MKKFRKRNIIIISTIVAILITAISITIYAAISKTATRGEIEVSTAKVNATTTYTATDNSFDWTYNEAGETKEIQVKTSNSSGVVLHRFYNIEAANTSDTNLLKAILVYYNDGFIGTLNNIANANIDIQNEFDFIPLGGTRTDSFKFELHQAAVNSMFDKKSINVTIKTFTENADYFNYIYVHNEEEFAKAVDDLNSGLFEENPVVVLCNTITLENSYTLKNPTTIYLNGCTLNGPLTLNDDNENNPDAVIEILGDGTFNANVTLGANYDLDKAKELVLENVKNTLKDNIYII